MAPEWKMREPGKLIPRQGEYCLPGYPGNLNVYLSYGILDFFIFFAFLLALLVRAVDIDVDFQVLQGFQVLETL